MLSVLESAIQCEFGVLCDAEWNDNDGVDITVSPALPGQEERLVMLIERFGLEVDEMYAEAYGYYIVAIHDSLLIA